MFSKGTLVFLIILITLFWYFIRFHDPKPHSDFKNTCQRAYFDRLCPYNGKWMKNMIFHDFFKLLLGGLRWCFGYLEMLLEPLEGVVSPRIHFGFAYDSQWKMTFSVVSPIRVQNVFWGSKHLLKVPKTSLHTKNII